jgi:hypothetical protein
MRAYQLPHEHFHRAPEPLPIETFDVGAGEVVAVELPVRE